MEQGKERKVPVRQRMWRAFFANKIYNMPEASQEEKAGVETCHKEGLLTQSHQPGNENLLSKDNLATDAMLASLAQRRRSADLQLRILQNIKHIFDVELEKSATPPIRLVESQIISTFFTTLSAYGQPPCTRGQYVLEMLLRKNTNYERDLQIRTHYTMRTIVNEIYQMIISEVENCPHSLLRQKMFPASGMEELRMLERAATNVQELLSHSAIKRSDVLLVSQNWIEIVLEDLSFSFASAKRTQEAFSHLICSSQTAGIVTEAQFRDHIVDLGKPQICSQTETQDNMAANQLPGLENSSSEEIAKYLVNNVFVQLVSFAKEKLDSVLMLVGCSLPVPGIRNAETNIRWCSEKLVHTILEFIHQDLEQEMVSAPNSLPCEAYTNIKETVKDLCQILTRHMARTRTDIQKRAVEKIFWRHLWEKKGTFLLLLASVENVLNQVTQQMQGHLWHLEFLKNNSIFSTSTSKSKSSASAAASSGQVAIEIVDILLQKMYSIAMSVLFSSSKTKSEVESSLRETGPLSIEDSCLTERADVLETALAWPQLQPLPASLCEELLQNIFNKICCFAKSKLEEIFPPSAEWKVGTQSGEGVISRQTASSDQCENSLQRAGLSKSDLVVYAKNLVNECLETIRHKTEREQSYLQNLRMKTLSSDDVLQVQHQVLSVLQSWPTMAEKPHHSPEDTTSSLPVNGGTEENKEDGRQEDTAWSSDSEDKGVSEQSHPDPEVPNADSAEDEEGAATPLVLEQTAPETSMALESSEIETTSHTDPQPPVRKNEPKNLKKKRSIFRPLFLCSRMRQRP